MKKIILSLWLAAFTFSAIAQQYPCPFVNAGSDVNLPCGSNCTTLNATYLNAKATTTYRVDSIGYSPYSYLSGVAPGPPFYTQDDYYGGIIPLPFKFCFFGNSYSKCVIGNNGMMTFDTTYAGGPNPWPLAAAPQLPSPSQQLNSIMGPYMDIAPFLLAVPHDSNYINYATIGTAPCRKFVVSFYNVPFYNTGTCPGNLLTSQMVLYETTNVIEIYIGAKISCASWNSGLAIEGIQNANGTLGYPVPGRNNSVWSVVNDGYRFSPNGPSTVTVDWYQGGTHLGSGTSVLVCPPNNRSTAYNATATYHNCGGDSVVVNDVVQVNVLQSAGVTQYLSCPSPTASVNMNATGTGTWTALSTNPSTTTITSPTSATTPISGFSTVGTYRFEWASGLCADTATVIVTPRADAGPDQNRCKNDTVTMNAYGTGTWTTLSTNPLPTVIDSPTNNHAHVRGFTAGGVYQYIWTTSPGCSDTMTINIPLFALATSTSSATVCQYANTTVTVTPSPSNLGPFQYDWLQHNLVQTPTAASTLINALAGNTWFRVQVTSADGCKLTDSVQVTVSALVGTNIRANAFPTVVCPGDSVLLTAVANPNSCGAAVTPCTAPGTTVTVGTGTSNQGGSGFVYPSPYGNYYKSAHHQFLIHANEILGQVPSGGQIKSLSMYIGVLNSASAVSNLTIRLACVGNDSISGGFLATGSLTQVYTIASYQPALGWNNHVFQVPYDWDGVSNLLVDVCFTSNTSGSTNPKMKYTTTPYKSIWCTYGNDPQGQCNIIGVQQGVAATNASLFQRPNMRFNMCITDLRGANLQWTPSTGPNAPSPTNLDSVVAHPVASTNYQVALTSPNGCINYANVQVNVDTSTRLTFNNDTFVCSVQPVRLTASVTGASVNQALVTYTWTASTGVAPPSGTGASFATAIVNPSATTVYTVRASGGGGCALFDSMRVTLGNGLPINKVVDSITCAGANNGKINVNMNAGTAPFTYVWTPLVSGNIDSAINLGPGTYIVQVTDVQGCGGRDTTTLVAPSSLTLRLDSTNILCYGNSTGTVSATVTGGRSPYLYIWTPSVGVTPNLTAQPAGTYALTVNDASGCAISGTVHITQPSQLTSSAVSTNLTGAGTHDGTISLITTGGAPSYTYASVPAVSGLPNATGLDTGIYIIHVCDANNCCVYDTAHITGPPPINVIATIINDSCFGQCNGQISVTASGGVGPYTFRWNTTPVTNSDTARGLCAGGYTVTITDANGISVSNTYPVTAPPALTDRIDSTLITCNGANNGGLNENVFGGTPPYTIVWTPGGSNPLTGLAPGTYSVQVTDAVGCTLTDQASLGQPPLLAAVVDSTYPATCFSYANGRAVISVTGGTAPYTIVWTGSNSTDTVANDLAAGSHTANITDSHGCTTSVSVNITEPLQLTASVSTAPAHCTTSNDGTASALASDGTPPYLYAWDNAPGGPTQNGLSSGSHTLLVTDAAGCIVNTPFSIATQYVLQLDMDSTPVTCHNGNDGTATVTTLNGGSVATYQWSSGTNLNPATGLTAGYAAVTVTDIYGCIANDSILITEPTEVYVLPQFTNPLCKGDQNGTIWLSASGGQGPYSYTFNGNQYQMSDTIKGLPANVYPDSYLFVVTDSKGCIQNAAVTLTDPPLLTVTTVVTAITCANALDGAITATAAGGTPPYTYAWTPSTATSSNVDGNLAPGKYTVQVTDANGCTVTASDSLVAPPLIFFTYVRSDSTSCADSSDGHIVVNVSGGTPGVDPPYTYTIDGQAVQNDSNFYNLASGMHQIVVYDGQHCHLDTSIAVYSPLQITAVINPLDTLLQLGSGIELDVLLGNLTFQHINGYSWSPASGLSCIDCPTPIATPYQMQEYTVVVNYGKNCTASASATVRVDHGPDTFIPNGFSPNGDGNNDEFTVYGTGLKTVTMRIFNRWGEKVFDSGNNQWASWDGTYKGVIQEPSVYTYVVELVYLDGQKKTRDGSITLIR
jgi:gliding motility-associated-like protein